MNTALTTRTRRQATPERWQRALERAMFAGVQVRQLQGSGQWIVTSASDPDAAYETDGVSCTCPAAMLGGDPICLHRAAYWHARGALDTDGGPASPAPSWLVEAPIPGALIGAFKDDLGYLVGAVAYLRELDQAA